jgi:Trypsin-like serine proteases, typically periplasmic, contain C-terminal PDZ domain
MTTLLARLGRGLAFLGASAAAGLAIAFLVVAVRPDLLHRGNAAASPPAAPAPTLVQPASTPVSARATYAEAVQRAAPAVVNIYTARLVTERVAPARRDQPFGDLWPRYRRRIERSLGSGVIVDADGHIVTNHHVIAQADAIGVQLADGRTANARIVGRDPESDLAVLRIDLDDLPVMPLGRSDQLKVGDVVLAIGNPIGLSQTVTHGIVSATSRRQLGVATFENFIQTDAPINFGNSGGALIDTNGELVGINTAIVAKNLGVEGIGFAIPVNMVRGVVGEIVAQGRVIRGWIGIVPEDVTQLQAAELGLPQGGVLVVNLYADGPAQRAGLQPGDLLTEIDGSPVLTAQDALAHVASRKPGQTIRIRGIRGRAPFEVTVTVAERPYSG